MRHWHARLNRLVFNSKLRKIKLTYGETTEVDFPVHGLFIPDEIDPSIHIDKRITTRRSLINVLAHEMVHQLQHEHKLPLTHGRFFKAHERRLLKHGIEL